MTRRDCAELLRLALAVIGALSLFGSILYLAGRVAGWWWR